MHNGGFGTGVAEMVMCWIAGADNVLLPGAIMAGKTLQAVVATFRFYRACSEELSCVVWGRS